MSIFTTSRTYVKAICCCGASFEYEIEGTDDIVQHEKYEQWMADHADCLNRIHAMRDISGPRRDNAMPKLGMPSAHPIGNDFPPKSQDSRDRRDVPA